MNRQPRVVVVGAGMSGLCMTWHLKRAGISDIVVLEKGHQIGGTWRDNTYPGLACDVPSRFYQFSFAPNPKWSRVFSPGQEIFDYLHTVAIEHHLLDHIRFGTEVASMSWTGAEWEVVTTKDVVHHADFVICSTGILHHPHVPALPGLDDFEGASFHSARWDHTVPLRGQRVGVIGTGSTGVQIVSELAGVASEVVLFQRSPHWVLTVPNPSYRAGARAAHRAAPRLGLIGYLGYRTLFEVAAGGLIRPGLRRRAVTELLRRSLATVRDPQLRTALTPDYAPMCRRLIFSPSFYDAVQRDDVRLVTARIDTIEATGVRAGGESHALDVLVLATGFDAHAYMRPATVNGRGDTTIDEQWRDGPRALLGIAVPGFPNFFMTMGPHSPVGNYSLTAIAEAQATHITAWIRRWAAGEFDTVEPDERATATHNAAMRDAMPGTVWASGCSSWYLGADGLPELWPWTPARYRRVLAKPKLTDWALTRSTAGRTQPQPPDRSTNARSK